jgi:hypothetical protein
MGIMLNEYMGLLHGNGQEQGLWAAQLNLSLLCWNHRKGYPNMGHHKKNSHA